VTGIELRTFPSADPVFHAFACEELDALRKPTTNALQDRVRARYPTAVVRAQEDLARRGGEPTVWYAFRYGTVAHGPPGMPVIDWDGPELAWAILDEGRKFVELNAALAAIVELPPEQILGRAVEEFTNPALWRQFVETRWVESTIRFNRMDGRRREFAYRIIADDPEPGLHRLRVAEIDPG
jgi:PAS domain-containing protein